MLKIIKYGRQSFLHITWINEKDALTLIYINLEKWAKLPKLQHFLGGSATLQFFFSFFFVIMTLWEPSDTWIYRFISLLIYLIHISLVAKMCHILYKALRIIVNIIQRESLSPAESKCHGGGSNQACRYSKWAKSSATESSPC